MRIPLWFVYSVLVFGVQSIIVSSVDAGFVDDLVRAVSRGGNNLPPKLRGSDDIAKRLRLNPETAQAARRNLDSAVPSVKKPKQVADLIDGFLASPSPELRKRIAQLAPDQLDEIVVLGRGSRVVAEGVGDSVQTARLLREGGIDLAAAAGLYGDEVVDEAIRIDALLRSGKLASPQGFRKATLQDFGKMIVNGGKAGWKFYRDSIKPYWKEWLAGGALAAYLVAPDQFTDAVGNLSEEGSTILGQLGGAALAGMLKGAAESEEEADEELKPVLAEHYFAGWKSVSAWFGLILLVGFAGLFFRRTRRILLKPFRWLNH